MRRSARHRTRLSGLGLTFRSEDLGQGIFAGIAFANGLEKALSRALAFRVVPAWHLLSAYRGERSNSGSERDYPAPWRDACPMFGAPIRIDSRGALSELATAANWGRPVLLDDGIGARST